MQSIILAGYGNENSITYKETDIPYCGNDDIIVKPHAVSVNPLDLKLISGKYKDRFNVDTPYTLCGDFAGTVYKTGANVKDLGVGDKVFGTAHAYLGNSGALAEFARVKREYVSLIPYNLDFYKAAAIVTPGCTAQQAVSKFMKVKPRQKVLIHGGCGAIGSIAIDLCRSIGAEIAVTVSGTCIEKMKHKEIDLIMNYELIDFEHMISDFDAVLDTVGGDVMIKSYSVLKPGGIIVSLVDTPDGKSLANHNIKGLRMSAIINTQTIDTVKFLVEEHIIKAPEFTITSFPMAKNALIQLYNRAIKEKIVINMEP